MTSLVTGASGFVGRALTERLLASGVAVRAAVRNGAAHPGAESLRIDSIDGTTDWSAAMAGINTVFHLAARVHVLDRRPGADAEALYRRTNIEGTRALARAAAAAGVRHFVFVSSTKVGGEETLSRPLREEDEAAPQGPYAVSKWEAEQNLNELRRETGMQITIVRPPLVYGPGVRANFLALMKAVDRGIPLPLGSVNNRRSLIYVGNLVDALLRCAAADEGASKTFYVSDGTDVTTPELIRELGRALHRAARLIPVPQSLLRVAGVLLRKEAAVSRLLSSLTVDISAIRRDLSWTPPYTMSEGLTLTAKWYQGQKS